MEYYWVDINEYSRVFSCSISTIRRRIANSKVESRKENGKYFIKVFSDQAGDKNTLELENQKLKRKNQLLQEEIQELTMLVKIFEQRSGLDQRSNN